MMRPAITRKLLAAGGLAVALCGQPEPKAKWWTSEYETRKQTIVNLLAKKEFAEAARAAADLNRRVPDDPDVHGYLAEAQIELGQYEAAEANVDWMFRLRPPAVESLLLGARLRDRFKDVEGALDFCGQAFRLLTGPEDPRRERVLLVTIRIEARNGRLDLAELHWKWMPASPGKDQARTFIDAARAAVTNSVSVSNKED